MDRRGRGRDRSNGAPPARVLGSPRVDACTIIAKNYVAHARVLAELLRATPPRTPRSTCSSSTTPRASSIRRRAVRAGHAGRARHPGLRAHGRRSTTCSSSRRRSSRGCCAGCSRRGGEGVALPRPRHAGPRAARRRVRRGARPTARAQPAQPRADAARRQAAERAGHPDRGRVQPRLHRHRLAARSPTSCSTGGASGWSATASSIPSTGFFVDQRWIDLVARDGRQLPRCSATPASTSPTGTSRAASVTRERDGRWWVNGDVPLRLFHFSRLRPRQPAPALQAPGPHPADAEQPSSRGSAPVRATSCSPPAYDEVAALAVHRSASCPPACGSTSSCAPALPRPAARGRRAAGRRSRPEASGFLECAQRARRGRRRAAASAATSRRCTRTGRTSSAPTPTSTARTPTVPGLGRTSSGGPRSRSTSAAARRRPAHIGDRPRRRRRRSASTSPATCVRAGRRRGGAPGDRRARDAGHPGRSRSAWPPRSEQIEDGRLRRRPARGAFPINLVCVNADVLAPFALDVGPDFFRDRHTIGWWWWEVTHVPGALARRVRPRRRGLGRQRFVAEALAAVSPVPVAARAARRCERARRPSRAARARSGCPRASSSCSLRLPLASPSARTRSG